MKIFCYAVLVLLLASRSRLTTSQEVENEREFNYVEGSGKGPEDWGHIHEEWRLCKNGEMQSPIDLMHERVQVVSRLGRLKRGYRPSNATLKNRGHDIMLKWVDDAGSINVNGTEYKLKQLHWHSPSEHTINGISNDLEVHMVHESSDKKFAVVGIMYTIGRPDIFLSELLLDYKMVYARDSGVFRTQTCWVGSDPAGSHPNLIDYIEEGRVWLYDYNLNNMQLMGQIKSVTDRHEMEIVAGVVDPRHLKMGSRKYYRYLGSLTTPPCTEGVIWTIVRKVRTVSKEQVRLLRLAVQDNAERNARPTQSVNEREVLLYRPTNP